MKIEKIDLKKKVMLALLAGNLLCANGALAANNTYVLNGGSPVEFDATSGYDPTAFNKTGNTIVFNIHNNYGTLPSTFADKPLVGAFDDTGNEVTLSGHDVTVNIDAGKYVLQNICGGFVKKGTVTGTTLTVTGGNVIPNYDGMSTIAEDQCLGVAGGFVINGSATYNNVTIKDMQSIYIAGGGYANGDDCYLAYNTITVENCNFPDGSFLVGAAATDMNTCGGNMQYNKLIINGTTQSSGTQSGIYGAINNCLPASHPMPAIGNGIEINDGILAAGNGIYGAYVSQQAKENYVIINGGTIKTKVYGAYTTNVAEGNYVIINDGTFGKDDPSETLSITGARIQNPPSPVLAKKNYVQINGGTFKNVQVRGVQNNENNAIIGGDSADDGNSVIVNNASFEAGTANEIIGGYTNGFNATVKYNSVIINNGIFTEASSFGIEIVGGYAGNSGNATNNTVNIEKGTFIAAGAGKITIIGGDAGSNVNFNSVTIKNGTFQGAEIFGGKSGGVSSSNKVTIDGGTFNGINDNKIYGGCTTSFAPGLASNEVVLNGGIFSNATIIAAEGSALTSSGNKITIAGSNALDLSGATLMGYEVNGTNDRTLNVERTNVAVKDIQNFGTINFNLTSASSDAIVLKMDGSFNVSTLNSVNINIIDSPLTGDDYIVLMQNVTGAYVGSSAGIMQLGNDLIYYTGTAPAAQKGDYTIKQGSVKGDSGTNAGSYTANIIGNTDGTGLTVTGGSLSSASYSGNEVIIRRGTYSKDTYICGAYYNGYETITMNYNSITVHNGIFHDGSSWNIGFYAAYASAGAADFTGNMITINDGDFGNGTWSYIHTAYAYSSGGSATNNSIVINGGNLGTYKYIDAAHVKGTATGNTVTINGGTFGSNATDAWINIYGVFLSGGMQVAISGNEVNINAGSFAGKMDIAGVYATDAPGANTYSGNKVNISGGSFDLIYVTDGKINIYGIYRNGSVTAANNNSVIIANAQFNLNDPNDEVNVYGAYVTSGNVEHNSVELHDGKFHRVAGGWITNDGNANYNVLTIESGTFAEGYDIYAGYVGADGNAEGNKIFINGGETGDNKTIAAGYIGGTGNATNNEITITGGKVGGNNFIKIYGAKVTNGSAKNNAVNINGAWVGKWADIYGGYAKTDSADYNVVKIENTTVSADCTVYGGNSYENYGSPTGKDAKNNRVEILDGVTMTDESSVFKEVIGGCGTYEVSNNTVLIKSGTYQAVAGGIGRFASSSTWDFGVSYNSVKMTGGTLVGGTSTIWSGLGDGADGHVYGGLSGTNGTGVSNNSVELDGVTIKDSVKIYGGCATNQSPTSTFKNSVTVANLQCEAGKYSEIYGGYSDNISSYENTVTIKSGAWEMVFGGCGNTGADGNKVIIDGGSFKENGQIYSGYTDSGNANENYITINAGTFNNNDIGAGYTDNGNSNGNIVIINDGNFENYTGGKGIWGGLSNGSGSTNENKIYINGGTFGDNIRFWGAYGSSGEAKDNIVEIAGGTFGNNFGLYGGYTDGTSTNNTLNLKIKMGGKASEVSHFQNMNFTLPSNITDGESMLETASVTYDNTTIGVTAANGVKLNKDDVIYLVKADSKSGDVANIDTTVLDGAAQLSFDSDNLILTLLQDFEQKKTAGNEDQQKAPVEGIAAAMQTVNMSADLASGQGMASLLANTAGGTTDTFGAMSAGSSKYKTGSHVDVDGWGLLVGAGKTKEWKNGTATTYGLFFEYGKGDFDTYNGNVHGDGNSKNQGIGIMMRHKMLNNTYYEGNIRYGKQTTEWSESELGSYDTDSKYYGIMVGMGHIFPAGKNEIDVYGRYTFGHVGACDATVGDSHYNFESVKSHRVRIGGKYNFKLKDSNAKPFIGLAWEHEFKGENKASISGVGEAPAPSMKGHTGIMEVGCDWKVSKKWTLGLGANAYMGKRKGWDGMARVFYNF